MILTALLAFVSIAGSSLQDDPVLPRSAFLVSSRWVVEEKKQESNRNYADNQRRTDNDARAQRRTARRQVLHSKVSSGAEPPSAKPKQEVGRVTIVAKVTLPDRRTAPAGIPFVPKHFIRGVRGNLERSRENLNQSSPETDKNGRVNLGTFSAKAGLVEIDIAPSAYAEWQLGDNEDAIVPIAQKLVAPKSPPLTITIAIQLQRSLIDFELINLPADTEVFTGKQRVNLERVGNTVAFSLDRLLAERVVTELLFRREAAGVMTFATLHTSSIEPFPNPYSKTRIDCAQLNWQLGAIKGLTSPFGDPVPSPDTQFRASGLMKLDDVQVALGKLPRQPQGYAAPRFPGERGWVIYPERGLEFELLAIAQRNKRAPLIVLERIRASKLMAANVAGLSVGDTRSKVIEVMGTPDPPAKGDPETHLSYLQGGLVFDVDPLAGKVRYVEFRRPLPFIREGLVPLQVRPVVALELPTMDMGRDFLRAIQAKVAITSSGFTIDPLVSADTSAADFFLKVLEGPTRHYHTQGAYYATMNATLGLFDRVTRDRVASLPILVSSDRYGDSSKRDGVLKEVWDRAVNQAVMRIQRGLMSGRVTAIDMDRRFVAIDLLVPNGARVDLDFVPYNVDEPAMEPNYVLTITHVLLNQVWCQVRKFRVDRNGRTIVETIGIEEERKQLRRLMNPVTCLVFATYRDRGSGQDGHASTQLMR